MASSPADISVEPVSDPMCVADSGCPSDHEDAVESSFDCNNPPRKVLEPELDSQSTHVFPPIMPESFPRKANKNVGCEHPVIIEMFCGSSRVTACLKMLGLSSSFGVDHTKAKAISTCKVADLTTKAGQDLLMTWLEAPNVMGIFAAPPCGTCSLARNIKLRDSKGRPIPGPVPLRSAAMPEGLPGLSKKNRERVNLANTLYEFLGKSLDMPTQKD